MNAEIVEEWELLDVLFLSLVTTTQKRHVMMAHALNLMNVEIVEEWELLDVLFLSLVTTIQKRHVMMASCAEFDECGDCGGEGLLGCIDSEACNYNTEASCDDGSCYFLPEVSISGANITTEFTSEIYEVILIEDAVYNWNVSGGVIEGNNDNYQPSIIWASEGIGEICVSIINGSCESIESCINVVIFPGGNIYWLYRF